MALSYSSQKCRKGKLLPSDVCHLSVQFILLFVNKIMRQCYAYFSHIVIKINIQIYNVVRKGFPLPVDQIQIYLYFRRYCTTQNNYLLRRTNIELAANSFHGH